MEHDPVVGAPSALRLRAATLGRAALAWDVRASARLQRLGDRSAALRAAAIPFARSADSWIWLLGAGVVALAGTADARRRALVVAAAIVATALLVKLAKRLAGRARPVGDWGGSYRRGDPHAFPSGHAARAALLTVLGWALAPPPVATALTAWTAIVAVSRVVLGVHYVSDVVGGALLGVACGLLVGACA